jgi:GTPase SAR1 family protein
MGCFISHGDEEAYRRSKEIDRMLNKARQEEKNRIKLLLLGTGSSGKSTICKQIQILFLDGYTAREKEEYKYLIISNLLTNMRTILASAEKLGLEIPNEVSEERDEVLKITPQMIGDKKFAESIFPDLLKALQTLWAHKAIRSLTAYASEMLLNDSAEYFFGKMDEFKDMSTYDVTEQDILRARKVTSGLHELVFRNARGQTFRMVDVGGQRNERRKWLHCFEGVTAVVYIASLSEYDRKLEEDEGTPCVKESLELFQSTINSFWFKDTPIILFLNKNDIFEEKIKKLDLGKFLPEYKGGCNADKARAYLQQLYLNKNRNPDRDVYVHVTTATNTENVLTVFNAVANIFLQEALRYGGF